MNLVNGTYLLHVSESVSAAVRPQRPPGASQSSASCRHFSASPCPAWPVVGIILNVMIYPCRKFAYVMGAYCSKFVLSYN